MCIVIVNVMSDIEIKLKIDDVYNVSMAAILKHQKQFRHFGNLFSIFPFKT